MTVFPGPAAPGARAFHGPRFQAVAVEPGNAIRQALASQDRPVFISDSGDNTTAGAPGDRVDLLEDLLRHDLKQVLLAGLTAAQSVAYCRTAAIGQEVLFPESVTDTFACLMRRKGLQPVLQSRGRLLGWYGEDAGACAVLSLPGIDMLLTHKRCAVISSAIIESAGLVFADYRIIVVKLGYLYPDLAAVAKKAYMAMTPGASCEQIESIPYRVVSRPVYPIDRDFDWIPANSNPAG